MISRMVSTGPPWIEDRSRGRTLRWIGDCPVDVAVRRTERGECGDEKSRQRGDQRAPAADSIEVHRHDATAARASTLPAVGNTLFNTIVAVRPQPARVSATARARRA